MSCMNYEKILTNTELSCFGELTASTVADNTAVAPFIEFLHTGYF